MELKFERRVVKCGQPSVSLLLRTLFEARSCRSAASTEFILVALIVVAVVVVVSIQVAVIDTVQW